MKKKTVALMSICLILSLLSGNISVDNKKKTDSMKSVMTTTIQSGVQKSEELVIVDDELIVSMDSDILNTEIENIIDNVAEDYEVLAGGFEINESLPKEKRERLEKYLEEGNYNKIINVKIKDNIDVGDAKKKLQKEDVINKVGYNYETKSEIQKYGIDDTYSEDQYYLSTIKAKTAWDTIARSGYYETWVAVIDTGLCIKSPEFSGVYLKNYSVDITTSYTGNYKKLKDIKTPYVDDHGTLVAGVLAAKADNSRGIAGVASAYDNTICKIMAIQASDDDFSYSNQIRAIQYAIENGADVINLSIAGKTYNSLVEDAIKNAHDAGITVVAAMGNDGGNVKRYPADYKNVISVSATDTKNNIVKDFNYGHQDICAPGARICTVGTEISEDVTYLADGTSLSTPIVSATVAMMKGINYDLTPDQIEDILYKTATDIGSESIYGNGLVNTGFAVQMAKYKGLRAEKIKIKSIKQTSADNVKLKWNEQFHSEGYCVYRSTSKNGTYKRIGTVYDETFTDKTAIKGKKYYYKVRGYMNYQAGKGTVAGNSVGYSTYSDIVSISVN